MRLKIFSKALARRLLIKKTSMLTVLVSWSTALELAASEDPKSGKKKTPAVTIENFIKISEFLTETSNLSPDIAAKILASFQNDAFFLKQLKILETEILKKLSTPTHSSLSATDFVLSHAALNQAIREILSAWYLGIRIVESKPLFFTYFDALIFKATAPVRSIPGICGGTTHFWSEPPPQAP